MPKLCFIKWASLWPSEALRHWGFELWALSFKRAFNNTGHIFCSPQYAWRNIPFIIKFLLPIVSFPSVVNLDGHLPTFYCLLLYGTRCGELGWAFTHILLFTIVWYKMCTFSFFGFSEWVCVLYFFLSIHLLVYILLYCRFSFPKLGWCFS